MYTIAASYAIIVLSEFCVAGCGVSAARSSGSTMHVHVQYTMYIQFSYSVHQSNFSYSNSEASQKYRSKYNLSGPHNHKKNNLSYPNFLLIQTLTRSWSTGFGYLRLDCIIACYSR